MLEIFRKSQNTNSFGQHQYWAADHAARCTVIVTATNSYPIGTKVQTYNQLGEHSVVSRGTAHTREKWHELLHEVVYPITRSEYIKQWRIANKVPPKQHPRRKQRMNPHRRALLTALKSHGGGYYIDSRASGVLEYDVSVCGLHWFMYVDNIKREMQASDPERYNLLTQHLPEEDQYWAAAEAEWDTDQYRFSNICEQMGESVSTYSHRTKTRSPGYELEYYSTNPVTGKAHDVQVQLAGRGGKHLVVTSFDGLSTPSGLADDILVADRTTYNEYSAPYPLCKTANVSEGYTDEWMRDFAQMITYWDSLDIPKRAREEFEYQEQYLVEQLIEQELDDRIAEHARLAATDAWFTTSTQTQGEQP
jgi:hypothetical protein